MLDVGCFQAFYTRQIIAEDALHVLDLKAQWIVTEDSIAVPVWALNSIPGIETGRKVLHTSMLYVPGEILDYQWEYITQRTGRESWNPETQEYEHLAGGLPTFLWLVPDLDRGTYWFHRQSGEPVEYTDCT